MALGEQLRRLGMHPKVVERLPGRLHVRLHLMKQLPPQHQDFARRVLALVCLHDGITAANPSFPMGDLLIDFLPDQTTHDEVLAYLRSLMRLLDRSWEPLVAVPMAYLPGVLGRLSHVLRQALAERSLVPDDLVVPEELWRWPR